jgi:MFS family permease
MAATNSQVPSRPEPNRTTRWVILIWLSMAMAGNYYFYDAIGPLQKLLQDQLGFSQQQYGYIVSAYSLAPIFFVLIGGIVIDRIGTRKSLLLFGVICLLGAMLMAFLPNVPTMVAGRLVFGVGAESIIVAITTAIAKWFKGKELSFALGINLMFARGGTWLAQNSPTWASSAYVNWQKPLLIGVGFTALCAIGPIFYWMLESRAEARGELGKASEQDKIVFGDLKAFTASYWYLVVLCVVFYSAIFPFDQFGINYFQDAKGETLKHAGFVLSILTMFTMVGTPIVGLFSDKMGRRATIMILGTLLITPAFALMAYSGISLVLPMGMLGIAFTLVPAIIWPSVAYIVPERTLGTALGLMTMIQNIGMWAVPLMLGYSNDHMHASATNPHGYMGMMRILMTLGLAGIVFAILLRQRETGPHGHGLETIKAGK